VDALGQAKVRDPRFAAAVDQDIGGLQVAMDDPGIVRGLDPVGQLCHQRGGIPRRKRPGAFHRGKAGAGDIFHRVEIAILLLTDRVDRDDIPMRQLGRRFRFAAKTLNLAFGGKVPVQDQFDRNGAVQRQLPSPIDDPHPAAADFFQQLEIAQDATAVGHLFPPWRHLRHRRRRVPLDGRLISANNGGLASGELFQVAQQRGLFSAAQTLLDVDLQQFGQQARQQLFVFRGQIIRDPRRRGREPSLLERLADAVDLPRLRDRRINKLPLVHHNSSSLQIRRTSFSRRSTVARERPISAAISAFL
jgi:hypothetical protein